MEVGTRSLEQLPNFRSAQVPGGQLYRSGYVERLSAAGVSQLSERVASIVDLRGRRELLRSLPGSHVTRVYRQRLLASDGSCRPLAEAPDTEGADRVRYTIDFVGANFYLRSYLRLPAASKLSIGWSFLASYATGDTGYEGRAAEILLKPRGLAGQAIDFVDFCQRELATVLRVLLRPGSLPCLLHCFLGKDRTGLVVLLLQWLVGVPAETMREEYTLSQKLTEEVRPEAVHFFAEKRLPPSFAECSVEEVEAVMQHIDDRYGGIESYLLTAGLTQQELQQLKATFGAGEE